MQQLIELVKNISEFKTARVYKVSHKQSNQKFRMLLLRPTVVK